MIGFKQQVLGADPYINTLQFTMLRADEIPCARTYLFLQPYAFICYFLLILVLRVMGGKYVFQRD